MTFIAISLATLVASFALAALMWVHTRDIEEHLLVILNEHAKHMAAMQLELDQAHARIDILRKRVNVNLVDLSVQIADKT